jgi:hypothetical protein
MPSRRRNARSSFQMYPIGDSDESQAGELVCEATYLNPVKRAPYWYTPSDIATVVRLQHVVGADLEMNQPLPLIKLPSNCKRKDALRKGAMRLSENYHELLLDEINRRDALDYEEEDEEESAGYSMKTNVLTPL